MIEVFVESIRVNMTNYKRVVMLKERDGHRSLPIWIGHFEADSIAIPMQNVPVSRPLTHDLLVGAMNQVGARWVRAVITRLENETFYATLVLDHAGSEVELDCRPSDAVAVAIRARVPIFVDPEVMDRSGMTFDPDVKSTAPPEDGSESATDGPSPYWPGAEPPGGTPPTPFASIGAVTEPVWSALQELGARAPTGRQATVTPGDLWLSLLRQKRGAATRVLSDLSVDLDELRELITEASRPRTLELLLSGPAEASIRRAADEAARLEESVVGTEHLLLALVGASEGRVRDALDKASVSVDAIRRQIAVLLSQSPPPDEPPFEEPPSAPPT